MDDKQFFPDYTVVCRTCLQSNVEMLSLSDFVNDNVNEENSGISYMEYLKACIQVEETLDVEMPQQICLECVSALRVTYWFMINASESQELLKLKLREVQQKQQQIEMEIASENIKKPKRYRCKICNEKVETKRSLKDHVKLHLDIIVYDCQLCSYENNNRNSLCEHYIQIHGVEATKEQLKPKTKLSTLSLSSLAQERMDGAIKNDHFQILPEDTQQISYEILNPISFTNSSCSKLPLKGSSLITTTKPNDAASSASFGAMKEEYNNDLSVANEFMVMADGSLEKVINKAVVIEYINATNSEGNLNLNNSLVLDNILQMQNMGNAVILEQQSNVCQMDVDDLIIEDPGETVEETQGSVVLPLEEDTIPVNFIEQPKKVMCKICTKDFITQEQLKYHMLTHNEIPHFFCDQCKFYTFFKIDLHQHYKSKHNLQPTNKQLQPKNKRQSINVYYACDLCFYEAEVKSDLKTHYNIKHNIEASEIQLKPTKIERFKSKSTPMSAKVKAQPITPKAVQTITTASSIKNVKISFDQSTPDYPNGLNCRKCRKLFYFRKQLYEHYNMHTAQEAALKQEKQIVKVRSKPSANIYKDNANEMKTPAAIQTSQIANTLMETADTTTSSYSNLDLNISTPNITALNATESPLTPSSSSAYTLPSDAVPQIVETDTTIENVMDFDFNCDDAALFGDFEDDVDVENDSDDNDSELRNVLLTSDDDFEDMLQDQNDESAEAAATGSRCAHCQKSFLSQYQFENHMFVHRGLAPYRCEMCTNLYNTKRCLIRHYRAVHKNVPTRDMIQAKGDKVGDDQTPVEHLKLEPSICLMCAKCPYESSDLSDIQFHLNSSHNISDESFIMKKLPFECPRCIRSFANKIKLLKHLKRNHSSTAINQQQSHFDSVTNASIAATLQVTTPTTILSNHVNIMKTQSSDTNASCGKTYKVNTSASTTKFLTQSATTNNNNNNHSIPISSSS